MSCNATAELSHPQPGPRSQHPKPIRFILIEQIYAGDDLIDPFTFDSNQCGIVHSMKFGKTEGGGAGGKPTLHANGPLFFL